MNETLLFRVYSAPWWPSWNVAQTKQTVQTRWESHSLIIYSYHIFLEVLRSRSPWTPVKTTIEINTCQSLLHVLKPLKTRQTEVCQSTSRATRNPVVLNLIYYRQMNLLSNKGQPKCQRFHAAEVRDRVKTHYSLHESHSDGTQEHWFMASGGNYSCHRSASPHRYI